MDTIRLQKHIHKDYKAIC